MILHVRHGDHLHSRCDRPAAGLDRCNRRMWDERVPVHVASEFYDVDGFKAGQPQVQPFEVEELGALGDSGWPTCSATSGSTPWTWCACTPPSRRSAWTSPARRRGRPATGRRGRAWRTGPGSSHGDVHTAADILGAGAFDVIYTGKGALAGYLISATGPSSAPGCSVRVGGCTSLANSTRSATASPRTSPRSSLDYFDTEPVLTRRRDLRRPGRRTVHNRAYEWPHPSRSSRGDAGRRLELQFFHEWDHTLFQLNDWLLKGDGWSLRVAGPRPPPAHVLAQGAEGQAPSQPRPGTVPTSAGPTQGAGEGGSPGDRRPRGTTITNLASGWWSRRASAAVGTRSGSTPVEHDHHHSGPRYKAPPRCP